MSVVLDIKCAELKKRPEVNTNQLRTARTWFPKHDLPFWGFCDYKTLRKIIKDETVCVFSIKESLKMKEYDYPLYAVGFTSLENIKRYDIKFILKKDLTDHLK